MSQLKKPKELTLIRDKGLVSAGRKIVEELLPLSSSEALNRLLSSNNSGQLVKSMTDEDFFWLVKKVGENDAQPILRLASTSQWEYILDMELWQRDRFSHDETFTWLDRFNQADPERLAGWLLGEEGNFLAHLFFFNAIKVLIKDNDDFTVPPGFITFDELFYIQILDKEHEEELLNILRKMSQEDYDRFHALFLGLAGVIPSEIEEEMYRLKGVRLAEKGYLPYEEAISVYSHQKAELLKKDDSEYKLYYPDDETKALVPLTPLFHASDENLFIKALSLVEDNRLLDRLRLEFAGLCNQIFSADAVKFEGIETLSEISKKAAGYLNIGLEKLSGGKPEISEQYINNNPLISIFRVGFGLALELKWEAERWIKQSWFNRNGLKSSFWGDEWGGLLKGIIKRKPLFFSESGKEFEYKNFTGISEIENCNLVIKRLVLLDRLLDRITSFHFLDKALFDDPLFNFQPLLFNFWAHIQLEQEPDFGPLTIEQTKDFFQLVRGGKKSPPFNLKKAGIEFIQDLIHPEDWLEKEEIALLKDTLSLLWEDFSEEYSMVETSNIDGRFTKFILIR